MKASLLGIVGNYTLHSTAVKNYPASSDWAGLSFEDTEKELVPAGASLSLSLHSQNRINTERLKKEANDVCLHKRPSGVDSRPKEQYYGQLESEDMVLAPFNSQAVEHMLTCKMEGRVETISSYAQELISQEDYGKPILEEALERQEMKDKKEAIKQFRLEITKIGMQELSQKNEAQPEPGEIFEKTGQTADSLGKGHLSQVNIPVFESPKGGSAKHQAPDFQIAKRDLKMPELKKAAYQAPKPELKNKLDTTL